MPKLFAGDSAVLAGTAIAAPGIWLSRKFGDPYFDLGALLVIALILMAAVLLLFRANGGLLSGKRTNWNQLANVREIISADAAVESVGDLLTTRLGTHGTLLTAAVQFKHPLNPHQLAQAVARLERLIKLRYPAIQHLHLESPSRKALSQPA